MDNDIFICEKCGSIEQIRTGYYPAIRKIILFDDILLSCTPLCSACTPVLDIDGSPTGYKGTWHNKFRRASWAFWGYPDVLNRTKEDI